MARVRGQLQLDVSNRLFFGDNLEVLRLHVDDDSVDLVYLDPPFKSDRNYNAIFKSRDGTAPTAQIKAFTDTWTWNEGSALIFKQLIEAGGDLSRVLQGFRLTLGTNDMLAYLTMMAPRLVELRRVLKASGSIYLHCDPTASHYLKVLMDAVFEPKNFQNEVVWYYKGAGVSPRRWGRRHDILLWYSKGTKWFFDPDPVRDEYASSTKERFSHYIGNVRGDSDYGTQELNPLGKHPDDVWQIPIVAPSARERLGFPTQKPLALLNRIIESSCPKDGVVLDPFCGCGTAVDAAQGLGRRWIGIDVTAVAINLIRDRLRDYHGQVEYELVGEPTTIDEVRELQKVDPFQVQLWACGKIGARAEGQRKAKRGADRGIDGELNVVVDQRTGDSVRALISVKGGKVNVSQIRDLRGVIEREEAAVGIFLCVEQPTRAMKAEAADAGFFDSPSGSHARLQILTMAELIDGVRPDIPWTTPRGAREERQRRKDVRAQAV